MNPQLSLLHRFQNWRSLLDYPLRQLFRWRRGGLKIPNESKDSLFDHLLPDERREAEQTAGRLLSQYPIQLLYENSQAENYRENLYYLSFLEKALDEVEADLPNELAAADIGPSDWFYVQALYALLKSWKSPQGRTITLTGFERDAYRVYTNFHSRWDHALAHRRGVKAVTYIPKAFAVQPNTYHVITMLFPFLFIKDHLEWGLPTPVFSPASLLASAWASLHPGGVLIIANQGKAEHLRQLGLMEECSIPAKVTFLFESPLFDPARGDSARYARFITAAVRDA